MPIVAVFAVIAFAAPVTAQTRNVQDYLPLAVGSSWTYMHEFLDARDRRAPTTYLAAEFTISIVGREVIDGETYYLFSDIPTTMPEGLPNHFLNGKKLRWDGNNLVEHDGTSSLSLYRFRIPPDSDSITGEYSIPATHGDTLVKTYATIVIDRLMHQACHFYGNTESSQTVNFVEGFGVYRAIEGWGSGDVILAQSIVSPIRAALQTTDTRGDGARDEGASSSVMIEWEEFQCYFRGSDVRDGETCEFPPTSTSPSSWGAVKDQRVVQ